MRTLPNAVELLASSSYSESKFSSIYRIMVNFTINQETIRTTYILDPVFLLPDPKWRSKQCRVTDNCILSCACATLCEWNLPWCKGFNCLLWRTFARYEGFIHRICKKIYWPSTRSAVLVLIDREVHHNAIDRAELRFAVRTTCKQLNSIRKRSHYIRLLLTGLLPNSRRTDHQG